MKLLKVFFILVVLLPRLGLNAQEIAFSKEFLSSKNDDIIEIVALWKMNIDDNIKSFILKDKNIVAKHWSVDDVKNGWIDIAKDNFSSSVPMYLYGENITYDISKKSSGLYEIRSLVIHSDSISKNVLAIYKTNALKTEEGFKLSNYFFQNKKHLNSYSTKYFDYYLDSELEFNEKIGEEANDFLIKLATKYGIELNNKITYIVGGDLNKANKILGFEFTIRKGDSPDAAYFLNNQGIIVASKINHKHEITHSIFETVYPDTHRMLHEGIATFYGGSSGNEYSYHKKILREFIASKSDLKLSKVGDLDRYDDKKGTNNFYTLGAVLIEMALEKGGEIKVKELFENSSNDLGIVLNEVLGLEEENFYVKIKHYLTR